MAKTTGIQFDKEHNVFNLQTPGTSYVIGIYDGKIPMHVHYGKKLNSTYGIFDMLDRKEGQLFDYMPMSMEYSKPFAHNEHPQELPVYGDGDYRTPAFHAQYADGSTITKLLYAGHKIYDGKPALQDMPSAYVESDEEAQTLEIYLEDELSGLQAVLCYTAYRDRDVITRSNRYINKSDKLIKLLRVDSGCIDLPHMNFDFVHFYGNWAKERMVERTPLFRGLQSVDSTRGASSHFQNPFICLAAHDATEEVGDVYGMNLVYSGNFHAGAFVDSMEKVRMFTGINPFDFQWMLNPGETFQTPECVMVYSDEGFGKMSHIYHEFIKERICRGRFRDQERPILINNWEATYFDFDEDKIAAIAEKAAQVGVELMVLDDGWFGKRNNDRTSLGDWFVNEEKLPKGLNSLVKRVNDLGMKFGLWFEPEMISTVSELYKAHPDWCLHVEGRVRTEGRYQLVLDLSREDVCEYIIETLSKVLSSANIEYIKWDMNRSMTEIGSAFWSAEHQREVAHRYMIGLYKVLGTLKERFPHILMEGCAGGGGRFDLGMFCYFDQFWTSDDTDAVERQFIQTGTSYGYPTMVMGSHVSACPNHQTSRITDINTRGYVAMAGQFGYELDLNTLSEEEIEKVREQIKLCKELAPVFHKGDMHRIKSPFDGNMTVWEFVSKDQKIAIVEIFIIKCAPWNPYQSLKLRGLDPDAVYVDRNTGKSYTGEALMYMGLQRRCDRDFGYEMLILEKQ
ncbi:MAG: alpha-galactosidase [Lachnospiraceae bacterium]|nr:alpha-galactosidase [Lachnospiraceae bacterium]